MTKPRKMSESSRPTVGTLRVPSAWRDSPHLLAIGEPYPLSWRCPITGDIEDRTGIVTFRYCEMNEMDLAISSVSGDWRTVSVYRYDPKSTDYILVRKLRENGYPVKS
jgi:hypothetical protein